MGIKNEDDNKSPRKPFIYYYLIVMIVMILFNALMVPWIQSRTVIEVPYSTFLEKVDAGQVTDVARTDSEIQFIANTGEKDRNGKEIYATYKTGPWPDEQDVYKRQLLWCLYRSLQHLYLLHHHRHHLQ